VNTECCRRSDGDVEAADWFNPSKVKIPRGREKKDSDVIYSRVANQEIRLHRQRITAFVSEFGLYYCQVRNNSTGELHEVNITLCKLQALCALACKDIFLTDKNNCSMLGVCS